MSVESPKLIADGSSLADAHPRVEIERDDPLDRYRYVCGNGHTNWQPTNGGIWCQQCSRQQDVDPDIDPHYHAVVDKKTDEEIPWSAVILK